MARIKVAFENESWYGEELDANELQILKSQLYNVIGADNAVLTSLFRDNEAKIIAAAAVAKLQNQANFTGMSASDRELGFQLIRPFHVLRSTSGTETPINTWRSDGIATGAFTASGDYWIGQGTNNQTAINIDKRLVILPLGVVFTGGLQPTVEELLFQLNATTYPVNVIRWAMNADNPNRVRYARIRPMIWPGKATVLAQVWSIAAQLLEMQLVGLTFGTGDILRLQSSTAAPQT